MTDSQPDRSQDFTSPEEEIYQRGRYDAFAEMREVVNGMMDELVQAHPDLTPAHEPSQSDQRLLDSPIQLLDMTNHALNILTREKVHTIRELTQHSEAELLRFREMGPRSIDSIKAGLMRIGQTLRGA